eukprot:g28024.t1
MQEIWQRERHGFGGQHVLRRCQRYQPQQPNAEEQWLGHSSLRCHFRASTCQCRARRLVVHHGLLQGLQSTPDLRCNRVAQTELGGSSLGTDAVV